MKKIVIVFALFCALFVCNGQEIYSKMNARTLLNIMSSEGYAVTLDKNADILWKKDGVRSKIIFSNGKEDQTNFYFVCTYAIKTDKVANAIVISNEFNKGTRFGKSYVIENAVVFQLTLNLRNGVTKERIIDYCDDCQSFVRGWKKEVVDKL